MFQCSLVHLQFHKATAQYWGELARRLADSYILPYDVRKYGKMLRKYQKNIIFSIENTGVAGIEAELADSLSMCHDLFFSFIHVKSSTLGPPSPVKILVI